MSTLLKPALFSICMSACLIAAPSQAAFIDNTSGLTGTFTTQTFNTNAGSGTAAANQFAGMTFGAGNYVDNAYNGAYPNMQGSVIDNFGSGVEVNPTVIDFSSIMSSVAFAFVSNPGTSIFSAYLGSTLVESDTVATGYGGNFYGFTGIDFNSIRINAGGSNHAYILDNLESNNVPEPGSFALLALGIFGLMAARRNKRA